MANQNPKLCRILVPVARRLDEPTEEALGILVERGYDVQLLKGCSEISLARNALATRAFEDGYAETMWIDADVAFSPDDVEQLRNLQVPMSAGLYVKRNKKAFAAEFFPQNEAATFGQGGGLLPIKRVGMGFTHIRREVYETIARQLELPRCKGHYDPEQWVTPWFLPMVIGERDHWLYLCEDAAFCERAGMCGFQIVADTRIRLGHCADCVLTWDDLAPRQTYATVNFRAADASEAKSESNPISPTQEQEPMSAKLYEQLGRKQEQLEELNASYDAILRVLAGVVSGDIERSRVLVNLTGRGWEVTPKGLRPVMPATINGIPQCVVAPEEGVSDSQGLPVAPRTTASNGVPPGFTGTDKDGNKWVDGLRAGAPLA